MLKMLFQTRYTWHISNIKLTFQAENNQYFHEYTYDARISAHNRGFTFCLFVLVGGAKGRVSLLSILKNIMVVQCSTKDRKPGCVSWISNQQYF